jgi:hypothetical protein
MVKKVYCKNCKYFYWDKDKDSKCSYLNVTYAYIYKNWLGEKIKKVNSIDFINSPETENENNDCKNYKRKWWKFFIN